MPLVLAGVERPVGGEAVDGDEGVVDDHVGVPGFLRRPSSRIAFSAGVFAARGQIDPRIEDVRFGRCGRLSPGPPDWN